MNKRVKRNAIWLLCLVFSGCATLPSDGGMSNIQQSIKLHTGKDIQLVKTDGDQQTITARTDELLQAPLTVEDAVQIALLNNKGLQATLYEVGISEADLVQASRLPNPRFSMLRARNGDDYKIEQAFTFNIFALFTMPMAKQISQQRLEQTRTQVTLEVIGLAADTRKAYFNAIAAEQGLGYMDQVKLAAEASAELAIKMAQAGNFSKLDQSREQVFSAEVASEYARSEQAAYATRELLIRKTGLVGKQADFTLPERLPELPDQLKPAADVSADAIKQRLDIQAIQQQVGSLAKNLGLTKTTRFINVLEIGPARVLEGKRSDPYKNGFELSFELPIFDFGTARVAKAEAIYMQALNRAAEQAVNAQSELREAYFNYQSSYEIAKHYHDNIVPLRKRISEENQLRYNGMLISVFELLADAQTQVSSVNSYIQALRDFWLADAELQSAITGKPLKE
ncbi:MAG: TolC family protein [Methylophilaceae bacterium]|nr:TolC family protein [Methyloradius sp.]